MPIAAGEFNVASSTLDQAGNLRIAFHRGAFTSPEVVQRAASYAACAVDDIQADVIDSFQPPAAGAGNAPADSFQIVLEEPSDNPAFADMVREQLYAHSRQLRGRVQVVPPSAQAQPAAEPTYEAARYAAGARLAWSRAQQHRAAARLARSGHNMAVVQLDMAFDQVRLIAPPACQRNPGGGRHSRALCVYSAERRAGGHPDRRLPAIRRAGLGAGRLHRRDPRRAAQFQHLRHLRPHASDDLPEQTYLNAWHRPYQQAELVARLEGAV